MLPNGTYYLPESDEIFPADMASASPDDRFHHCTYDRIAMGLIAGADQSGTTNLRLDVACFNELLVVHCPHSKSIMNRPGFVGGHLV